MKQTRSLVSLLLLVLLSLPSVLCAVEASPSAAPTEYQRNYHVQHRLLPHLGLNTQGLLFADLAAGRTAKLNALFSEVLGERAKLITYELLQEGRLVLITFPTPSQPVECYFAALVRTGEKTFRYITLEMTHDLEQKGVKACLCEWDAEKKHLNHGPVSDVSRAAFLEMVKNLNTAPVVSLARPEAGEKPAAAPQP